MLHMIGETALAAEFESLQRELLSALRQDPRQSIFLREYISVSKLRTAAEMYIELIKNAILTCHTE